VEEIRRLKRCVEVVPGESEDGSWTATSSTAARQARRVYFQKFQLALVAWGCSLQVSNSAGADQ
jgi:hypothetical protein